MRIRGWHGAGRLDRADELAWCGCGLRRGPERHGDRDPRADPHRGAGVVRRPAPSRQPGGHAHRGTGIPGHTQAVWTGEPGDPGTDQLVSGMGFVHADYAEVNRMDADRLAKLLDRTGPAIILTHSAGAPAGWLVCELRHDLVKAHVALEPIGPAFGGFPGLGELTWGLSAQKPHFEPEPATPEELKANPSAFRQTGLAGIPTAVIVAEASPFTAFEESVSDFVNALGGSSEFINIADHGVHGNGHGMMLEANAAEAAGPIIEWISKIR